MFNRIGVDSFVQDSTSAYSYTTAAWQAADASNNNRVTYVVGITEDSVEATYNGNIGIGASCGQVAVGIGIDATNAVSGATNGTSCGSSLSGIVSAQTAVYGGYPGLGLHFVQMLEWGGTGATFNATTAPRTTGMRVQLRM